MAQINFSGVISPRLFGQVDMRKFQAGLAECDNFIPLKEGSLLRRPGTVFIANAKAQDREARLIPFIFSDTQSYVLEMGAQSLPDAEDAYIRFFKNGAPVMDGGVPYEVTTYEDIPIVHDIVEVTDVNQANDYFKPSTGVQNNDHVVFSVGEGGNLPPNLEVGFPYFAVNVTSTTFRISLTEGGDYLRFTPGSSLPVFYRPSRVREKIPIWYEQDDLFKIRVLPKFDVLYLLLGRKRTLKLLRFGDTEWKLQEVYYANIPQDLTQDPPVDEWSDEKGWPACATYHNGRMKVGGIEAYPQKLYASISGVYDAKLLDPRDGQPFRENFGQQDNETAVASDGWGYSIDVEKYNRIQWMTGTNDGSLLIGTTDSERLMKGKNAGVITPALGEENNPPEFFVNSEYGTSDVPAIFVGGTVVAAQKPGNKLRSFDYSWENAKFIGSNLNRLTEHLTKISKIKEMAYQDEPEQILWDIRVDGSLQSLTFVPEEQVFSWATHSSSNAFFKSIAAIPGSKTSGSFENEDEIWFLMQRVLKDGFTEYTIERMAEQTRHTIDKGPIIAPVTGRYTAPLTVTISNSGTIVAGNLYYTLDGSIPRQPSANYPSGHGTIYTVPFIISQPVTVRAVDIRNITTHALYTFVSKKLYTVTGKQIIDFNGKELEVVSK